MVIQQIDKTGLLNVLDFNRNHTCIDQDYISQC